MVRIQPQITDVGHAHTCVWTHLYGAAGKVGLGSWTPGPQALRAPSLSKRTPVGDSSASAENVVILSLGCSGMTPIYFHKCGGLRCRHPGS